MSTLRTLTEAFTELERRADALSARSERSADAGPPHQRQHPHRRAVVISASVVGAAAVVAGVTIGVSQGSNGDGVTPAASSSSGPTTLWKAEDARCPAHPARHASTGAVLRYDGGCIRLVSRAATFHAPLDAKAVDNGKQWVVEVDLNGQQTATFAHVTKSAVGHLLAIVDDGTVISAPTVEGPITSGRLQILVTSKAKAQHIAQLLTTGGRGSE